MHWRKLGQIYVPDTKHPKLLSHAANPLPVHLKDDTYRVFYSGRDAQNRSSVGYVDLDLASGVVSYVHDRPVFEHGWADSFYSHGVSIGNCYEAGGVRYMLFMGWQCAPGQHWRGDVGRLILEGNSTLVLDSETPFLGVDGTDPISLSYPWVMRNKQGLYQMWYGSTLTWNAGNGEMVHVLNRATSPDGHAWTRHGLSVPYRLGIAQAFSRPTVISDEDGYHMWFSYRSGTGERYRIGYAFSALGDKWELLLDKYLITPSESGWDSEMIEYPFVWEHKGSKFMLYNGNDFGRTGFGLAILE